MTKRIVLGARGSLVVYYDGKDVRIKNESSCALVVDGELLLPGQEI